jgi:hypothetical protein
VLSATAACPRKTAAPTVEPASKPASSSPAPVDPLRGLDAPARWSWAVDRFPALARPDRVPPFDVSRFGKPGSSVVLYSPDLAEHAGLSKIHKPCAPIYLAVRADRLETRIPAGKGTASPRVKSAYYTLELASELRLGIESAGPALLSELSDGVVRYEGTATSWTVVCAGDGKLRRSCGDGTQDECSFCQLALVGHPSAAVPAPTRHYGDGPCPACPTDHDGPVRSPLARVAAEQRFVSVDAATGPVFYRTRDACKASRKPQPAPVPAPRGRTHGTPLHPALVLLCDSVVVRADGTRHAASLYESTLAPLELTRWFARLTGLEPREQDGVAELQRHETTLEIAAPARFEADRCADPSKSVRSLVRVSTRI